MDLRELLEPFVRSPFGAALWLLNLALVLAVGFSFAWGSLKYLRFADVREPRKRLLATSVYLGLALAVPAIALAPQRLVAFLMIGGGLFLASLYCFWGAVLAHRDRRPAFAFVKTPPVSFVSRGPYRFVRHPIYTAYLLAFLALACLSQVPLALLAVGWLGYLYYRAAREEESTFGESPFAVPYRTYLAETGMFLPRWPFRRRRPQRT